MTDTLSREQVEKIYDDAKDYWLNQSDAKGEMRALGIPPDADAVVSCSMGELDKLCRMALRSLDAGAVREATIQECARVAMNPKLFEHYTDGPLALCGGVVDAILALGQINAARKGTTSNFNDTYDQNARRRGQYDDTKDKP